MPAAADHPRSSVVVLAALHNMKDSFRGAIFDEFDRLMLERSLDASREGVALGFFHMRRELCSILDEYVIRIQALGVDYHLTDVLRDEIRLRTIGVQNAWFSADVRVQEDIGLIQRLFEVTLTRFMIATYDTVADAADPKGICMVCLDHQVELVFLPCGHACSCRACYTGLRDSNYGRPKCPACRERVTDTEAFTQTQRLALSAGGDARHSRGSPIFMQAHVKRSFCVMGNVIVPGLS
jgi:ferredoxin